MSALLILPDEESSEEEPEKFFNADREPGQATASRGCCLGAVNILLALMALGFGWIALF